MLRQEKLVLIFESFADFKATVLVLEEVLIKKYGICHVTEKSNLLHLNLFESNSMFVA